MSKQKRWCPAIEQQITPAECGQNRASHYDCPAGCPFNPWSPAKYDQALEIEEKLEAKLFATLRAEKSGDAEFQAALRGVAASDEVARQQFFVRTFYLEQDAAGKTFAQRLAGKGREFLSNDESVLLSHLAQMRPALLEIHQVRNEGQCEAVNLLETERQPFILQDHNMAARATRFMQALGWSFAMPYYRRLHGVVTFLPEMTDFDAEAVLREIVAHLGGPVEPAEALRDWLGSHMSAVDAACRETTAALRRRMWEEMDANFCQSVYRIRGDRGRLSHRLGQSHDFAPDQLSDEEKKEGWEEAFDCFDEAAAFEPNQPGLPFLASPTSKWGRPLLGRLLLGRDRLRLDATASARFQALKARLQKLVGQWIEFASERIDDVTAARAARTPVANLARVPPVLLENPHRLLLSSSRVEQELPAGRSPEEAVAELIRRQQQEWIDLAIPALGGKTPRQAAGDPELRPALIRLLKAIIRRSDEQGRRTGRPEEINWLPRALGLDEIVFPAPPPHARVAERDDDWQVEGTEEDALAELLLERPPPLPARPLTPDEIVERMAATDEELPTPEAAWDALEDHAPALLDAIAALTEDCSAEVGAVLATTLARVWFVFFPLGTAPRIFQIDAFLDGTAEEEEKFVALLKHDPSRVAAFLESGPQPALAMMLSGSLFALWAPLKGRQRRKLQLEVNELPLVIGALRSFIAQAESAARGE